MLYIFQKKCEKVWLSFLPALFSYSTNDLVTSCERPAALRILEPNLDDKVSPSIVITGVLKKNCHIPILIMFNIFL